MNPSTREWTKRPRRLRRATDLPKRARAHPPPPVVDSWAGMLYVDAQAGSDDNDGREIDRPLRTLAAAVDAARTSVSPDGGVTIAPPRRSARRRCSRSHRLRRIVRHVLDHHPIARE